MSYRIALAVLLLAVTTACGSPSAGQGADLRGKVYVSSSVTEQGKPRAMVEGTRVELRFTDDGRLMANAGCNQMQGPVQVDDGRLAVGELGMTAMGCPKPELHQQDEWLSKLLGATPSWKLDGANLVITGSNSEIVLAPEQPATLEGIWTVNSLVTQDAVSSVPEGVKVTITFKGGNMLVDTGCNLNGAETPYVLDGQTIKAKLGASTLRSCGPVDEVENAVRATFENGEATHEIDRATLSLTNASGAGLKLGK
ncbi:META domain-containing protein [Lentzea albidocapillata subsp. violacea]|uniref:META domain-containing protein n=1 Tax=Lentzea albidocapillata subsp. violacea TaxID=128104 RepID=A0A1G8WLX7_9PSEU|nr:META domain-containing protein [Lentzea albidocapillata]SDJ79359.1 META domain-containing protein [Lentzea albidocapillata subsp. violacea]